MQEAVNVMMENIQWKIILIERGKNETKSGIQDFLEQMRFSLRQSNIMLTGEQ